MAELLLALCHSVGISALGAWLAGRLSPVHCHCSSDPVDRGVLNLLQSQLDRCGPEALVRAPVTPDSATAFVLVFLAGLITGVVAGSWAAVRLVSRAVAPHSAALAAPERPPTPQLESPLAVGGRAKGKGTAGVIVRA